MKYLTVFFFLFCLTIKSQETSTLFNRSNLSLFNPSFTGIDGSLASLSTRSQWSGVEDAPRVNSFIYHFHKKKKVNLGIVIQNDKVFIENKTHLVFNYNYNLKLSEDRILYLGLKAGGYYNDININEISDNRIFNTYNPALKPIKSYINPVFGLGFNYVAPNYFLGIGMPNLFKNKRFKDSSEFKSTASDYSYFHFTLGSSIKLNESIKINPLINYFSIPDDKNIFSANIDLSFDDKYFIGPVLSNRNDLGLFLLLKLNSNFDLGYGYEFTSNAISEVIKNPTHELLLKIKFNKKPLSDSENVIENNDE